MSDTFEPLHADIDAYLSKAGQEPDPLNQDIDKHLAEAAARRALPLADIGQPGLNRRAPEIEINLRRPEGVLSDPAGGLSEAAPVAPANLPQPEWQKFLYAPPEPVAPGPSQITSEPIGSSVTSPAPWLGRVWDYATSTTPPTLPPSQITNEPVGSTVTAPSLTPTAPGALSSLRSGAESAWQGLLGSATVAGALSNPQQIAVIDQLILGNPVPPDQDTLGLSQASLEQLLQIRQQIIEGQGNTVARIQNSRERQATYPVAPVVSQAENAQTWGGLYDAVMTDPVAWLQHQLIAGSVSAVPIVASQVVGGPLPALALAFNQATGGYGGANLLNAMQRDGVDPHDANAIQNWFATHTDEIRGIAGSAAVRGAIEAPLQVLGGEANRLVGATSLPGRLGVAGASNVVLQPAAPYASAAATGEPLPTPAETAANVVTALPFAFAGVGTRPEPGARTLLNPRGREVARETPLPPEPPPLPDVEPGGLGGRGQEAAPAAQPVVDQTTPPGSEGLTTLRPLDEPQPPPPAPPPGEGATGAVSEPPAAVAPAGDVPVVEPPVARPDGTAAPVVEPEPAPAVARASGDTEPPPVAPPPSEQAAAGQGETVAPAGAPTGDTRPVEQPVPPVTAPPRPPEEGPPAPVRPRTSEPGVTKTEEPPPAQTAQTEPPAQTATPQTAQTETPTAQPETVPVSEARKKNAEVGEQLAAEADSFLQTPGVSPRLRRTLASDIALLRQLAKEHVAGDDRNLEQVLNRLTSLRSERIEWSKIPGLEHVTEWRDRALNWLDQLEETPEQAASKPKAAEPEETPAPRTPETVEEATGFTTQTRGEGTPREAAAQRANRLEPTDAGSATTMRAARTGNIFRDAGHDPDVVKNMPRTRQFAIAREQIMKKFGFKDVTRDNTDHRHAVDQLQDAYRNLQMMAHVLGVPETTLSDNGRIGLALRSNRRAGFFGAYMPRTRTIALTGRANSFAHEFGHALDHMLIERLRTAFPNGLASDATLARGFTPGMAANPDTAHAFAGVMAAIFSDKADAATHLFGYMAEADAGNRLPGERLPATAENARRAMADLLAKNPSQYARDAASMGALTRTDYWMRPHEMLARAWEAYISHKIEALRDPLATNEFITRGEGAYLADSNASERLRRTFPKDADRERIFNAMDELVTAMQRENIMGREAAAKPPALDIWHPKYHTDQARTPVGQRVMNFANELIGKDVRNVLHAVIHPVHTLSDIRSAFGMGENEPTNEPVGKRTWAKSGRVLFTSTGGAMHMVAERIPGADGRAAARELANHVQARKGSGELDRGTYHQTAQQLSNRLNNRIYDSLRRAGYEHNMPPEINKQLYQLLTGDPDLDMKTVSPLVRQAAREIRNVLDDLRYFAEDAGLNVGATDEPWLHRQIQMHLVERNAASKERFLEGARRTYADQFDEKVNAANAARPGLQAEIAAAQAEAERLRAHAVSLRGVRGAGAERAAANKAAGDAERAYRRLLRQQGETVRTLMKIAKVPEGDDYQSNRADYAAAMAREYLTGLSGAKNPENFVTQGPAASFTRERVLPASADQHLREFYEPNIVANLSGSIRHVVMRAEFARRFGADNAHLEEIYTRMERSGALFADVHDMKTLLQLVSGQTGAQLQTTSANKLLTALAATGQMAVMGRAWMSSLAEPAVAAIITGDWRSAGQAFNAVFADMLQTPDALRRAELAEAVGLYSHAAMSDFAHDIMGDYFARSNSWWSNIQNKYYERTLLAPLDRMQRRAAIRPGEVFIRNQLERVVGDPTTQNGRRAQRTLNEYGITAEEAPRVLDWLNSPSRDGGVRADDLQDPQGQIYRDALGRFVENVIQAPSRADIPELANSPVGRFFYALARFNYAFVRQSYGRIYNATRAAETWGESGRVFGQGLATLVPLLAATTAVRIMRDQMFGVTQNETDDEYRKRMGLTVLSAAGAFGPYDPIINAFMGLKYQRDMTGLVAGPYISAYLQAIQLMAPNLGLGGTDSARTNTAERNMVKGMAMLASIPMAIGFAQLPGGVASYAAFAYLSSPIGRNKAADVIVGPSNVPPRKHR